MICGSRLDPADWEAFRAEAHGALDRMIDHISTVRDRPVWKVAPPEIRARFMSDLPGEGSSLAEALDIFETAIKPYATGNLHPTFMGWVHGAGTPVGMVAEMLAAGLNANCGGRDHIGVEVERQITRWMRQAFGFPEDAAGLFVTGTSIANFLALLIARYALLGDGLRRSGQPASVALRAYASEAAHGCIARAMEMAGLGSDNLRRAPCGPDGAVRVEALRAMIAADRARGATPFLLVGSVGTVNLGAVDPLDELADLAAEEGIWFHVDGAFGALAAFSPRLAPLLKGLERADSVAFDFRKWGQVPYAAGFLLTRDGDVQRRAFMGADSYLTRAARGLAAGEAWPCDYGPDLSRGFQALKTWFTIKVFGADALGRCIEESCDLARYLARRLTQGGLFEVKAPVTLNIVCFGVRGREAGPRNRAIVEYVHASGAAAPSVTILDGEAVIRCAIVNHRTRREDIDAVAAALEGAARTVAAENAPLA
ncbi:cytochrome D ubiquinol oxidase subunit I [Rhodoblastus acidophilus]|uniref:Cytochrome D ubiquinol oxidase subunit I n=1 Tax=Candidatus Rhodoblastus alkanivorans TaxID=2954117 RepID=A0ABS9ZAC2_9HYPH|nr:cytochrome D ubiquinol oxidase subunit I [Candidatus Rhodoblastus alkanivorans]MCI4684522.1 cytochrome D ubiquinol oxidase subunit I [Candidatus Rhodoblastus alkanivorans]MDI4641843.1 cytochrome D ubiquinol oxidase subunit I [Rhodoblastus acidophilus]